MSRRKWETIGLEDAVGGRTSCAQEEQRDLQQCRKGTSQRANGGHDVRNPRKPCSTELHMRLPRALNCVQRKQSNRMKVCPGNPKLTVIYIDIQPLEQTTHRLGLLLIF